MLAPLKKAMKCDICLLLSTVELHHWIPDLDSRKQGPCMVALVAVGSVHHVYPSRTHHTMVSLLRRRECFDAAILLKSVF